MRTHSSLLAATLSAWAATASGAAAAQDVTFVWIGTGGVTGVYFPTGGAIQRLVNSDTDEHDIRISVESTGGSVYNLFAMRRGELDMGVAQSDQQYNAYHGVGPFADAGPMPSLRAVFSIHGEPFTVVARADAGIDSFEDLPGHRVNVGNPGSGQRANMERLMEAYGWSLEDFSAVSELPSADQAQALCDDVVDAIVFTVGHPSGSIQEATTTCNTELVPVQSAVIDRLVADNPYYAYTTIPGGTYQGNPDDVVTFGPKATLVTTSDLSEDVVHAIVTAVFDDLDAFRLLHPAFATLEPEEMVGDGLSAPLHEGAIRYYREHGLVE